MEQGLPDYEEEILRTIAMRGKQPNLSFFAFTATPKYRTMEVFGRPGPDGKPQPFHLYSMRQAIEEEFILDVLEYYTMYKTYFRLVKASAEDPEVDKRKAARALMGYLTLHPHNLEQKTGAMVEHFRRVVRHRIGGRAKAMVVTSSRLHAVRCKQTFDRYLKEHGYEDIKTLVAFSDEVKDPDAPGIAYTEKQMNEGIGGRQLPEKFGSDEFQILIVAEKFQTGFDQPLLHTMYVDKRLAGIQAVQTLSRLNRIHPAKEDTFVLDFVNEADEILSAFQPYYERTLVGEQVKPGQLYELQAKLDKYQIYFHSEVEEFARLFYRPRSARNGGDHARLNACIDPAVKRYQEREEEEQEVFRRTLVAFRNLYSFLAQIIPFQDSDLEKLYAFARFLLSKLPRREGGLAYRFDDEVSLKYYRLQKIAEGKLELEKGAGGDVSGPTEVGTGTEHEELVELSQLIEILNDRLGTTFKPSDQLFFDSIREDAVDDSSLRQAALANTKENFGYVFRKALEGLFIDRMDQNEQLTALFLNNEQARNTISKKLLDEVYEKIHVADSE